MRRQRLLLLLFLVAVLVGILNLSHLWLPAPSPPPSAASSFAPFARAEMRVPLSINEQRVHVPASPDRPFWTGLRSLTLDPQEAPTSPRTSRTTPTC